MGLKVTLEDKGLLVVLARMQATLKDTSPVMKAIGRKLESNINVRFDTKTAPDGSAWAPWAESTAAARAHEGRGTLLEYTGRMRDSLAFIADNSSVEVGFGVPYAKHHEHGTKRMPARPVLFHNGQLAQGDLDDAVSAALSAIKRQFNKESAP